MFDETYGANVFERDNDRNEYLTEIGISNLIASSYEIYINPNNDKKDKANLIKVAETEELSVGYHTIELPYAVKLTGEKFVVVVKYINSDENNNTNFGIERKFSGYWVNAENSVGESFLSNDMNNWMDINSVRLEGANLTIKAFTKEEGDEKLYINLGEYKETNLGKQKYLMNIEPQTKVSEFKNNILTNGDVQIEAEENIYLATGMKVAIALNSQKAEYIIVVAGDVDKDGDTDLWDMSRINKYRLGKINLPDEELLAGDVDKDSDVDLWDMSRINKYRLGKINKVLVQ